MDGKQSISKAIVYIENNLYEPLTAASVAQAVSYSYYHFHRYFQAVMGETIGSYIRGRRLTQAAYSLVHTDKKIIEIAVSLYFESAESFTRAFKSKYGITPTEYRKNGIDVLIGRHDPVQVEQLNEFCYANLIPEIVLFPETWITGIRFDMSIQNNPSVKMWEKLNRRLALHQCGCRYSVYKSNINCHPNTFNENSEAIAFIGIETYGEAVPPNMEQKCICGGKYAKFVHNGTIETLLDTYLYIWGIWFPRSGYQLSERNDFERYTERFLGPKNERSQIEIYLPVE